MWSVISAGSCGNRGWCWAVRRKTPEGLYRTLSLHRRRLDLAGYAGQGRACRWKDSLRHIPSSQLRWICSFPAAAVGDLFSKPLRRGIDSIRRCYGTPFPLAAETGYHFTSPLRRDIFSLRRCAGCHFTSPLRRGVFSLRCYAGHLFTSLLRGTSFPLAAETGYLFTSLLRRGIFFLFGCDGASFFLGFAVGLVAYFRIAWCWKAVVNLRREAATLRAQRRRYGAAYYPSTCKRQHRCVATVWALA
ncbi:MAG: hypothetical protein ACI9X4_000154 [Glaciecola sp.]